MLSSAFRSFNDPDEYEQSIRAGAVTSLRLARGPFQAKLTRVDLGSVWMQRFQENTARTLRVAVDPSRSGILFRVPGSVAPFRHRGIDFDDDMIVFLGAGTVDHQSSGGAVEFGSLSLSPDDLARFGPLLAERDLSSPRTTIALRSNPMALTRLRSLHAVAASLARTDPARIEHSGVSKSLESALITAIIGSLARSEPRRISPVAERRAALIRRLDDHLQSQSGIPVYVTELCQALSVTERSLERACQEHLGMGPKRYLWLRRLNMARRALIESDASRTTVASIALAHGFWELGQFAVRYRQVFGESPSFTLRAIRQEHLKVRWLGLRAMQ